MKRKQKNASNSMDESNSPTITTILIIIIIIIIIVSSSITKKFKNYVTWLTIKIQNIFICFYYAQTLSLAELVFCATAAADAEDYFTPLNLKPSFK